MKSSREQFEKWVKNRLGYNLSARKSRGTDEYVLSEVSKMWESWQASREYMAQEEVTTAPFIKVSE